MEYVGQAEVEMVSAEERAGDDCAGLHSFYPEPRPKRVSQVDLDEQEKSERRDAQGNAARLLCLKESRRYLPCHYFDFICGSSTGA